MKDGWQQNICLKGFLRLNNIQTSMIYTYVSNTIVRNIVSPVEGLKLDIDKNPVKKMGGGI